ncbi:MAG TPA: tRNA-dihydrouridine synthase [Patescibacteria group bacterium]
MKSIWETLPKPIFSLAPMEDVTDTVFRQIINFTGKPDVYFTEFTNVDGMNSLGDKKVSQRLKFGKNEKPLIAQLWGVTPENFYLAAKRILEMGFDGIDLNMGCPQRDVTRHGACSALIKNHNLAKEIIDATRGGAGNLPVSVKTRLGFSKIQTEEWIGFLLTQNLPLITIHGRTVSEMSKVPAHWDEIGKVVKMRDEVSKDTLIFGNGDVMSLTEAKEKVELYGLDGIMIGRGIFHNPWLFAGVDPSQKSVKERLELLKKHVELYEKIWREKKNYQILKKYFKIYLSEFEGASDMRQKFMETNNYSEALELAENLLNTNI